MEVLISSLPRRENVHGFLPVFRHLVSQGPAQFFQIIIQTFHLDGQVRGFFLKGAGHENDQEDEGQNNKNQE